MAVAFLIAIGSTAYTDHTQAAQAQPTQGQEQQMQQQKPLQMQQSQGQQAVPSYPLNLPKQSLAAALNTLSEQTDIQVLFPYDIARSHSIGPLQGNFTIEQALVIMLRNTGLHGGLTPGGIIAIAPTDNHSGTNQYGKGKKMNTYTRKTLLASMVGLFAAGGASGSLAQGGEAATEQGRIDEILVTATKREAGLNDTALSISAIGSEDISQRNIAGLSDYLSTIPNVNMLGRGMGENQFIIRGIASDPQQEGIANGPSVGLFFGEVPMSGYAKSGGSADLRLVDMERIEVLRGPQGTLFGSGTLAGAVRHIPNAPELQELTGSLKATYSNTARSGDGNNKIEGVINIPLIEDELAIRAVAFRHDESGYIKNTILSNPVYVDAATALDATHLLVNEDDIGATEYQGGRIAALWTPSDDLSITLQHATQDGEQKGLADDTGYYTQSRVQAGGALLGLSEGITDDVDLTNLVIEYDLGWASLLSSSAWLEQSTVMNADLLSYFIPFIDLGFRSLFFTNINGDSEAFIQEVRLTSQHEGPLQYLAGVYYDDSDIIYNTESHTGGDLSRSFYGEPFGVGDSKVGQFWEFRNTKQLAVFGEVNYELNEQLELTLGARWFDYDRKVGLEELFGTNDPANLSPPIFNKSNESDINFKANLSYRPNDDTLVYMQWAEGYRMSSLEPRNPPASQCDVDNNGILDSTNIPIGGDFGSDWLENLEFGLKLTSLEGRFQLNATVYQSTWDRVPLAITAATPSCFRTVRVNAGEAVSRGVEIETQLYLTEGLKVGLGGNYKEAEFTEDAPQAGVVDGDRLPGSADYTAYARLQYDVDLMGNPAYFRGDYSYMGNYYNNLQESGDELGGFGKLNISAGVTLNQISLELFASNLTNADEATWVDSQFPDNRSFRLRPRTLGLNIGYQF